MSNHLWITYTLFNEPPGRPKKLKCVNCKVASGCACIVAAGGMFSMAKRYASRNGYISTVLGILGATSIYTSFFLFKMASENKKQNALLQREFDEEIKKSRLANKKEILSKKTQPLINH